MATGLLHVLNAGQADAAFATVKANGNTTVRRDCCVDARVGTKYDVDVLTLAYFIHSTLIPKSRRISVAKRVKPSAPCSLCVHHAHINV